MATETLAPVVEKPASTDKPAVTTASDTPKRRFEKPKSITEMMAKPTEEKPKVEAKPKVEPEKVAKTAPEAKENAPDASKSKGDTETTPKAEKGSLRASLAQGEPVEDDKPKAGAVTEDEPVDDDDPTLTEKMRKRVNKLKGETAKERTAREAAEKKAQELEARLAEINAKPKLTEAQQKEQEAKEEELLRLRRRFSLETDPEVKKFDTRIEATRKVITDAVANSNLPEWVKDEAKKLGGIEMLARSEKTYRLKGAEDGKDETITGAELYRRALGAMNPADADSIRVSVAEQRRIQAEKSTFIEEESKKAKDYFAEQAKQVEEQGKQQQSVQAQTQAMFGAIGERITKEKWMLDEEVPVTGDEQDIKAVKVRNALRGKLRNLVNETINFKPTSTDPETARKEISDYYFGVIRDSAKLYYAENELRLANDRVKKLEGELDAIKGASRTTPKNGNGAAAPVTSGKGKVPARESGESLFLYNMRLVKAGVPEEDRQAALRAK